MSDASIPNVWVLADPKAGTASQAIGIAEALGWPFQTKMLHYNCWARLPNIIVGSRMCGVDQSKSDAFTDPFPEIVIASGRRTAPVAQYLKKQARIRGKDLMLVHCMDPEMHYADFDCVFIPEHDQVSASSTIVPMLGAPHRVSRTRLDEAFRQWHGMFPDLPETKISVLVGGNANGKIFTEAHAEELAMKATALATALDAGLLITTSRRTSGKAIAAMKSVINCPYFLYDWQAPALNENPYMGFLALATAIVVTGDSVSMPSEALATGKPLFIYAPDELVVPKFKQFHQSLYDKGYAKKLGSTLRLWRYESPDIMSMIVSRIKSTWAQRVSPNIRVSS